MEDINKFENGKIYKIVSDLTDKIYIGSTILTLNERLSKHKNKFNSTKSVELTKLENFRIELIENFPCDNKYDLEAREAYHIRKHKKLCLNKAIPHRTGEEYRNDNKDKISERQKKVYLENQNKICDRVNNYRLNNLEKIKAYKSKDYICDCGLKIQNNSKYKHVKTKYHQNYLETINSNI
jgi:hypothetical protein